MYTTKWHLNVESGHFHLHDRFEIFNKQVTFKNAGCPLLKLNQIKDLCSFS